MDVRGIADRDLQRDVLRLLLLLARADRRIRLGEQACLDAFLRESGADLDPSEVGPLLADLDREPAAAAAARICARIKVRDRELEIIPRLIEMCDSDDEVDASERILLDVIRQAL